MQRAVCLFPVTRSFCRWQTLDINCTDDHHVLLVMSARYGRMKVGRCVAKNYGYVGCSVDVVGHVASLCSARSRCRFEVPDDTLKQLQPCPKDFASYLELSYVCVPGTCGVQCLHFNIIIISLHIISRLGGSRYSYAVGRRLRHDMSSACRPSSSSSVPDVLWLNGAR